MRTLFGFLTAIVTLMVTAFTALVPKFDPGGLRFAVGTPRSIFETRRCGLA